MLKHSSLAMLKNFNCLLHVLSISNSFNTTIYDFWYTLVQFVIFMSYKYGFCLLYLSRKLKEILLVQYFINTQHFKCLLSSFVFDVHHSLTTVDINRQNISTLHYITYCSTWKFLVLSRFVWLLQTTFIVKIKSSIVMTLTI